MAKKLNKKVAVIGIIIVILVLGSIMAVLVGPKVAHRFGLFQNPDKSLEKARQLLEAGDYENAEIEFGLAYAYGKTDAYKIERLFELSEFHLINNDQHDADWNKACGCWEQIIKIDPGNLEARNKTLDFLYQVADAGDSRVWKMVNEQTTDYLDVLEQKGIEPDSDLLTKHARSLLMMAQRGESTNRQELLDDSVRILETLIEKNPENDELYRLRAQAAIVQGELDQLAGIRNASDKSHQNAVEWFQTGIEQAEDKAAATANLLLYKLQTTANDPNEIELLRSEVAAQIEKFPLNPQLLLVQSVAYENLGNLPIEIEIDRAINAMRQAHELEPDNIEYIIRMYRLLYRKGSSLNDPTTIADAIALAEKALTLPGTQDVPGPLQGRNQQYRILTNSFLADAYLEKAFQANKAGDENTAQEWRQKAEARINEIRAFFGTAENPAVMKFEGMLALADGNEDEAVRLMYQAYEQTEALDKEGQSSNVDPVLCITLADLMKEQGKLGMQGQFLRRAIANSKRMLLEKPHIILDYADVLSQLHAWPNTLKTTEGFQQRFGTDLRSQTLKVRALVALKRFDEAQQALAEIPDDEPISQQLKVELLTSQIIEILTPTPEQDAQKSSTASRELSPEQAEKLRSLRTERNELLQQLLVSDSSVVDTTVLIQVCQDLLKNGQVDDAAAMLETYGADNTDNIPLKIMYLRTQAEDPMDVSAESIFRLQEQAYESLQDPVERQINLSQLYRKQGDYDKAHDALAQISTAQANSNPKVLQEKFELALQTEDLQTAENLLRPLREQNIDGCEGNKFSAQLEYMNENYTQALRQLEESLILQPLSDQLYFLKSRVYEQLKDYPLAIENMQTAITMRPLNATYARSLASLLFARNDELGSKLTPQQQTEAQDAVTRAMFLNPSDWRLQSVYAETISRDNPDDALHIRQMLLKNYPNVENALMLGNMAMRNARLEFNAAKRSGLLELANTAYRQAIQLEPENETAQQVYADFLRVTGKGQEAVDMLKDDQNLLWKYYLRNSQFTQAQEILNELYEQNPQDITVLRGLILTAEGMGNRGQVKAYLDKLAGLDDSKEAELWVFQKYLDNGYTTDVKDRLASFKERYPQEPSAILIEAWLQMRDGNLDDSLSLTNRYLETKTENASAWRLRGRLYRLMNQPQKAISDLQRSKSIQTDPMVRLELASVYIEMENPQGAIGELREGLNEPQAPSQLWFSLEKTYKDMGNFDELEKFYAETLEKFPGNIFWIYRVGNYYMERQNYPKAQQFLKQAWDLSLQQENQELDVLMAYMKSLYENSNYDEVFSLASEYIDTIAAPAAYTYMALVQLKLNQPDKARQNFETALQKAGVSDSMQELVMENMLDTVGQSALEAWYQAQLAQNPEYLPAHLLAYRLAQKDERYNLAIEHLDKCIEVLGDEHPAWMTLAIKKGNILIRAYIKTADDDYLNRSIAVFEAMLQKQPENPSLLNNLAYMLIDNNKQIETALEYARKAQQADPDNPVYMDTYAYTLCKTGRYAEAKQNLLRAIQLNEVAGTPIPWEMYKHMAMAYEGQGNIQQALENYQKALQADEIPEKEKIKLQQSIEALTQ